MGADPRWRRPMRPGARAGVAWGTDGRFQPSSASCADHSRGRDHISGLFVRHRLYLRVRSKLYAASSPYPFADPAPASLLPLARQAWHVFAHARGRVLAELEPRLAAHGLTVRELDALLALDTAGGVLRMWELAASIDLSPSRITRVVDGLVAGGLVAREPDPDLPRAMRARLLPAGDALLVRARRELDAAADRAGTALGPQGLLGATWRRSTSPPPRAADDPGLVHRELERELRARGSSVAGLRVLAALEPGARRMRDLAADAGTSPSRLSRVVDELERDGLVRRTADPRDGRAALAAITPDGRDHLAAMRGVHDAVVHARFAERLGPERLHDLQRGWAATGAPAARRPTHQPKEPPCPPPSPDHRRHLPGRRARVRAPGPGQVHRRVVPAVPCARARPREPRRGARRPRYRHDRRRRQPADADPLRRARLPHHDPVPRGPGPPRVVGAMPKARLLSALEPALARSAA